MKALLTQIRLLNWWYIFYQIMINIINFNFQTFRLWEARLFAPTLLSECSPSKLKQKGNILNSEKIREIVYRHCTEISISITDRLTCWRSLIWDHCQHRLWQRSSVAPKYVHHFVSFGIRKIFVKHFFYEINHYIPAPNLALVLKTKF